MKDTTANQKSFLPLSEELQELLDDKMRSDAQAEEDELKAQKELDGCEE